ncbi:MAG TPA: hypothetical protein VFA12_02815 [Stellaceae bacterium]|nr:hypothetical protein [Stellaceae bacterium]
MQAADARQYRDEAQLLRQTAARAGTVELRDRLLRVARAYDALALDADRWPREHDEREYFVTEDFRRVLLAR